MFLEIEFCSNIPAYTVAFLVTVFMNTIEYFLQSTPKTFGISVIVDRIALEACVAHEGGHFIQGWLCLVGLEQFYRSVRAFNIGLPVLKRRDKLLCELTTISWHGHGHTVVVRYGTIQLLTPGNCRNTQPLLIRFK